MVTGPSLPNANSRGIPTALPGDSTSPQESKVKNIFNLSAWLYIGSAVSASSGMGIVLLKLAGKAPFTKPFGVCVLTSVVLGFFAEMYKDKKIDFTLVVDAMKSYVSKTYLGEGSSFEFENQKYYIAQTKGDGACGAHALLGTKENGYTKYEFRAGNVRDHYIKKLVEKKNVPLIRTQWKEWMVQFVKDYLRPYPGYYSSMVFSESLVKELREGLARLEQELKDLKVAQGQLFNQVLQDGECHPLIEEELHKVGVLMDHQDLHGKIRENLNDIIAQLADKPICTLINGNIEAQMNIDRRRDQLFDAFAEKDEVLEAYKEGISTPAYYFATQEIGLMAHLFEKHVTVFHEHDSGVLSKELDEGHASHPAVEIFHKGIHFSRCERVSEELVK